MKIINVTKDVLLADKVFVADTAFKRMRGLLGKKELPKNHALILQPCNSVHTFFMQFPIDVLFVDKTNRIVEAIPSLKPSRMSRIYFHAHYVVELPSGTILATLTSAGDTLLIRDTL